MAGNVFLNFILSASFQYLWDLINAQQIVILLPLFEINTPQNVALIFNYLMMIAAFELVPTDDIYENIDDAGVEAVALNDRYEQIGLEHWLYLSNQGTFGFIIAASMLVYMIYYCLICFKSVKCCRKTIKSLEQRLFWGFTLRLIIESYIITFICCLLNLRKLDFSLEYNWILSNSIIAVVSLPIFALFPVIAICYMWGNFADLGVPYRK